ncbi:TonB-dependent receptor plug domain-containing protein [Massilia aurea]|uniref:TonB-dependent receptor plug domain-containing protein n=1 Tax=Massilia aurea TaxID=373040 RepID=UPI002161129A|nr:TonB-dependent receptor [Massilia aurea]MCS0709618.1 TonB-dependent receptor [Massilia aurea]
MKLPMHYTVSLLIAASVPIPAAAQTEPGIPQVDIRGSAAGYDARRDDTATRTIIKRDELTRYGDRSILDALRRVPGVTIDGSSGQGGTIQLRGLGAGYTQVLINGERAPGNFSFDTLSPEVVERIEVLRAATADLSTQAVAGTVNIVLRHVAKTRERELKLGMLGSDVFRGPNASLQLSDRREGFAWSLAGDGVSERLDRVNGMVLENTGTDGAIDLLRTTATDERGRMRRLNLTPRLEWTLAGGDKITSETFVNVTRFRNRGHALVTTLIGGPPPAPDLVSHYRADDETARTDLRWSRGFPSGASIEAKLGLTGERSENVSLRDGRDAAGNPETDGRIDGARRDRGINSTGKAMRKLGSGHALATGWDGSVTWRDETRIEQDRVRTFPSGLALDETFEARVTRLAMYAQDEWDITPHWSMYLGLRWEGIRTRASGNSFASTRSGSGVWSPVMQTLWKIPGRKGDQMRFALTRTYKEPDLWNLLPRRQAFENNSATEADFQGNPNLKPELAWGIDAGYEHYWAENAMVSIATSLRRIDDYTSNRIYFDGYRWIFTPVNDGRAETRSVELETKFPLKSLFADAPEIDVRAGVARHWSRVESVPGPDNRLERQTPLSANLGIDYRRGALTLGSSVAHKRNGQVRVTANRGYYTAPRTDLDAYAAWRIDAKRLLRLSLANLLRENEGFEPSYADPVTGLERRRFYFAGPLRATLTYQLTF